MTRRNLTLGPRAFISIITASIESYKKESFGLLLGCVHKHYYHVVDAIPYQMADREYDWVSISSMRVNRINYVLKNISDQFLVGDYHSHPDFPGHLSGWDKKEFRKSGTPLSVIALIKRTHKKKKWTRNEDLSISGTIGKRYFVKIIAYDYDKKDRKIHRIKIVCPYIRRLNKGNLYCAVSR